VLSKGASEGKEPGNETTLTLEFISCFLWQPFVAFLLVREERDTLQKVISTERIMIAQADDVSKVHETGFEVG
jgi:hypothetical protein